jgi:Ser-tRNA(Ala) deacylase AlaX
MENADGSVKFVVKNIACKKDAIWHIGSYEPQGSSFGKGDVVTCKVNEELRRLAARFHSAGHLLDMAMNRAGRPDLKPSKGYHFTTGGAYVEYIGAVEEKARA